MISLSRRCQYALRAVLELAKRKGGSPTSVSEIAEVQAIPRRFLELIIKDLKAAGMVEARRGARGGYTLAAEPQTLTVGEVIRLMQGEYNLVDCRACGGQDACTLEDDCAFSEVWRQAHSAMTSVFDNTNFAHLAQADNVGRMPEIA